MHDWEKPHIYREADRYFFTMPLSETASHRFDVTDDVKGWINQERERCIAALLAENPMEVSFCDKIHGDGWWEFKVREVLERAV